MKVSLLKIGFTLVLVSAIWIGVIFVETEKIHDEIILKESNSFELKSEFMGADIGFYKVYMPEFVGEEVFVQILDTNDNVIEEQSIQTKMSVGYFDFDKDGSYTIKLTNISKNPIYLQIEFGDTNSKQMIPAGVLLFVGAITVIVIAFFKIKNYNIEQPDENIS
ncbi:MAG: hypothetical protein K5790_06725 [Nitrosopumilus sp.]|uniref:hypothetical protein n=1 Tax=Nitrosopumilus sp. TaxID=2024843 RepID=UPI00247D99A3|nr:hypothetical protein [Nitrosopumilus sp.]MCV0392972.1 hypothetical protein [Nitrosopumilus sp.]